MDKYLKALEEISAIQANKSLTAAQKVVNVDLVLARFDEFHSEQI